MKQYNTLELFDNGPLVILKLNRPEKRNALNAEMIAELTDLFTGLTNNPDVVLLNIVAKGESFCAGADLGWLMQLKQGTETAIAKEFSELGRMLHLLSNLPQVTVAMVHGSAYGGGIGLLAACDYVISAPNTTFSFSEIKLGLVPATISPYIVERIGKSKAKRLFFTGERFDENLAHTIGLVDDVAKPKMHEANYQTMIELLLTQPRNALTEMKKLFKELENGHVSAENYENSSSIIAKLIGTEETQGLLNSFLKPD